LSKLSSSGTVPSDYEKQPNQKKVKNHWLRGKLDALRTASQERHMITLEE